VRVRQVYHVRLRGAPCKSKRPPRTTMEGNDSFSRPFEIDQSVQRRGPAGMGSLAVPTRGRARSEWCAGQLKPSSSNRAVFTIPRRVGYYGRAENVRFPVTCSMRWLFDRDPYRPPCAWKNLTFEPV
jgi:hypothetical protein